MKRSFLFFASAVFFLGFTFPSAAQIINTVAGNGTAAFSGDGVAATTTGVNNPYSVAVDAAGNCYIADYANNRIRKVNTSGVISTIAGTGVAGFSGDNGPAVAAEIYAPRGVAVDGSGNVYFSDYVNQRIRKINTSGIITTIAGNGSTGFSGNGTPATNAMLNYPWGLAVDGSGNVYFADQSNSRVRKVDAAGIITTFAGTGSPAFSGDGAQATLARLNNPSGVAVDAAGNVFIADYANNKVRKVTPAGIISTIAGVGLPMFGYSGDGGQATAAQLYYPTGVAVDVPGNVYICDRNNNCVRKIGLGGVINTIAGSGTPGFSGDGGLASLSTLDQTTGVAVGVDGDVYISDNNNNRIRRIRIGNAPFFTNGRRQSVTTCPTEQHFIDTLLRVDDIDVGQTETWSQVLAPLHGALVCAYTTTSTGSTITPSGLTYVPAIAYYGEDSFKVRVFDGMKYDTTTIIFTMVPLPDAGVISGVDSVCPGHTRTLTETSTLGVWSSSNAAVATVSSAGIVTGLAPGTANILYTVINFCGNAIASFPFRVLSTSPCISAASLTHGALTGQIQLSPNPSRGTFSLEISSVVNESVMVEIRDMLGRTVKTMTVQANNSSEINIEGAPGVYFITAHTATWRSDAKLSLVR